MTWGAEPTLVTFFIPLLDRVGLPHDSVFTFERDEVIPWLAGIPQASRDGSPFVVNEDGRNYVSLKVWRPREKITVADEPLDAVDKVFQVVTGKPLIPEDRTPNEETPVIETAGTVITAVTPLIRNGGMDLVQAVGEAFDRCLEELGVLVRAYVTEMGANNVRLITRRNVYPIIVYWLRLAFDDAAEREHRMLFIHNAIGLAARHHAVETDPADLDRVLVKLSRIKQGDPLQASSEQFYRARRAFWIDGDFAATVSAAYTSGEVLLNTVLLMIEWEKGTPRQTTKSWFEEQGLAKRLRTLYHVSLGGNWNPQDRKCAIGTWMLLTELRGRVVHAGYLPTETEAEWSLSAVDGLYEFVKGRLATKVNTYPRTSLLLLGKPGLIRFGAWGGKIESFVEQNAGAEEPWIASFRAWLVGAAT